MKDVSVSFKGLGTAKISERGQPLPLGTYILEVKRCLAKATQEKGDAFIVELKVVSADHPATVPESQHVRPGTEGFSWFQKILPGTKRDTSLGAIKAFCLAVMGVNKDDKDKVEAESAKLEDNMDKVTGPEQVFAGSKVKCTVILITTKEGKPFHLHQFSPA